MKHGVRRSGLVPALLVASLAAEAQVGVRSDDAMNVLSAPVLRVMTLNIGHGRGRRLHQSYLRGATIRRHLDAVGRLVSRENVVAAALQEVDAPSWWSRGVDQLARLSRGTSLDASFHGIHATSPVYRYGTALIASAPFDRTFSAAFPSALFTPAKGFVFATLRWEVDGRIRPLTLASVHLDFLSAAARRRQAARVISALAGVAGPLVVMGDFNSTWGEPGSVVRGIAEDLSLEAFRPGAQGLATYPRTGQRIDWILISEDLAFADYRMVAERVSDHLAVVADIVPADSVLDE